ncbi:hypothetical protein CFK38_15765 [Brachybacterium vulturis]|uniref:Nuclease PIN n=1 Tax=Brachybacterium vulturis TaxID=2017484 RepID=A0A291GRS5_9MICO|nr:DUF47 family protein [Brachybacterium vulturis]ATG52820.1 hypothetical protein CFK38_15765 [Brachybacterium vulturis]
MAQFLARFFPQRSERPLYDLFAELAELLVQSADTHSKLLGHGVRERTRLAPRLHEQSTVAEELCRRIAQRLAHSLITPYEAELLYDFALTLSDTLDSLEHTAELLVISQVGALPTALLEAAEGIERAAELTVAVTWQLSRVRDLGDHYEQVRKLKRQGDRLVRRALGELYTRGGSAQELLPQHDVAESIRQTITLQERSARIADLLRVKDS